MNIELIYITKHYACGCVTAKAVRPPRLERDIYVSGSPKGCPHVKEPEPEPPKHYMVDGYKMYLFKSQGYWKGSRHEKHKTIIKHFGRQDPRPLLMEAL
jgi:hypothetical protein